jgi:hypothetical protein
MRKKIFTGTKYKRKATNAKKQLMYLALWGEEAPKGKKKVKV